MSSSSSQKTTAIAKETAKLQIAIAKETQDFWREKYKTIDTLMVSRVNAMETPTLDYEEELGRFITSVKLGFQDAYIQLERCFNPYATGFHQVMVSTLSQAETRAIGDAVVMAYRYAELKNEALDDLRFGRLVEVSGIGRGLLNTAGSFATAAGRNAASLARQSDQSVAEAGKAIGFLMNRNWSNSELPKYNFQSSPGPTMASDLANTNQYNVQPPVAPISSDTTQTIGGIPLSESSPNLSLFDSLSNIFKGF